ncbi:MAG: hypothetical protein ACI9G1_005366, partial [Pirellulaceae bacterium]
KVGESAQVAGDSAQDDLAKIRQGGGFVASFSFCVVARVVA